MGILGTTYVAPLGTARAMVGPTKEYDAARPRIVFEPGVVDADVDPRAADALAQLRELGVKAYPPTADWDVLRVKYGVRGNPPRTPLGALPAGSARASTTKPPRGSSPDSAPAVSSTTASSVDGWPTQS